MQKVPKMLKQTMKSVFGVSPRCLRQTKILDRIKVFQFYPWRGVAFVIRKSTIKIKDQKSYESLKNILSTARIVRTNVYY